MLRCFFLGLFCILGIAPGFAETRPNVILFVVDDMGWTDLGCYGSDFHQTPNIDKLASEGILFTDAYSAGAVCSPTRASLMSGKYPARLHITAITDGGPVPKSHRLIPPDHKRYLDLEEFTLAQAMKAAGYHTIHLGKWHLGKEEHFWPEHRGFDVNIGGWRPGMPIVAEGKSNGFFSPYGNPRLKDGPEGEYLTERLTTEAVALIKAAKEIDQPFYMNFWYYTVHVPLQAVNEKIEKYSKRVDASKHHSNPIYAAMVEHLDDSVGKVVQALKEQGLEENTVIILTSDNGGFLGGRGRTPEKVTSNHPLRSGKGDMFEGGVRVPFIAKWKDRIKPGSTNSTPIISCDLYPTILKLAQTTGDQQHNADLDGVSLDGLLFDEQTLAERSIFWHSPHYSSFGERDSALGTRPHSVVRRGDWKLIEVFEDDDLMLFNLADDIGEQNNLSKRFPAKAKELQNELVMWRDSVAAQMPKPNPNFRELVPSPGNEDAQ